MIDENTPFPQYNQFQHMTLAELNVLFMDVVKSNYPEDRSFILELAKEIERRKLAVPANE